MQLLLIAALIALVVVILVALRLVVIPVVIALMLAAAAWPFVAWLRRHGAPAPAAAAAAVLGGLAVLAGLGTLVVVGVSNEWTDLRDRAVAGIRDLEQRLNTGRLPIDAEQFDQARTALGRSLSGRGVAGLTDRAVLAAEVVAGVLLAGVVLFFFLKDGPRLWQRLLERLPVDQRARAGRLGPRCMDVLGAYVRGTTVIALVDALIIGTALVLFGVPLALPLAVLVFLGAYIPLAGATVTGALAVLVALVSVGWPAALAIAGVVIVVNQLEGDVLAPLVLGRAMRLHPLAILLGLTAGAVVAGVIGALLAVPAVAVGWTVLEDWDADHADAVAGRPP